eukprot:Lankesteria_metandrocarpae@DN1151_c0_g1_i1.p1
MAEHLARIIGTEEDRVNCPFYWKIGACRHGDQCSRSHYKPSSSPTLILRHMYQNPPIALAIAEGQSVSDELADQAQDHFEAFYEEVFEELGEYGDIEDMVVCDNIGDHMIGNVYVKYTSEDFAERALKKLYGRYYSGRMIEAEYSPVTDFREACCRQFADGQCTRGGYCNFMHKKHIPRSKKRDFYRRLYKRHPEFSEDHDRERDRERRSDRAQSNQERTYGRADRHSSHQDSRQRQSSEERRSMIAEWNKELE